MTTLLRRHGITLGSEDPTDDAAFQEDAGALAALAAASVTGRSLLGATPGARVGRVGRTTTAPLAKVAPPWHARAAEFDLHGGRTVRAEDRGALEKLCDYLLRPPLAQERVENLPDGRVGLTLAHPWADGTCALVFGGVESLEKLAVLIPKPRVNLLMYHGILGAGARRRAAAIAQVVPLEIFNNMVLWDERVFPWLDLAELEIERTLDWRESTLTSFSLKNMPKTLGMIPAKSIYDYNSLNYMRAKSEVARKARRLSYRVFGMVPPIPDDDNRNAEDWGV